MSHKILVVEDDAATAAYIVKGMTEAGSVSYTHLTLPTKA